MNWELNIDLNAVLTQELYGHIYLIWNILNPGISNIFKHTEGEGMAHIPTDRCSLEHRVELWHSKGSVWVLSLNLPSGLNHWILAVLKEASVSYFFSASGLATSQGEQQCSFPIHVLCTICFEYLVYSNTKAIFSFYFGKTLVGIRENWGHYSTIKPQINRQEVFKWFWNACIDKPISIILPSATRSEIINILRISK